RHYPTRGHYCFVSMGRTYRASNSHDLARRDAELSESIDCWLPPLRIATSQVTRRERPGGDRGARRGSPGDARPPAPQSEIRSGTVGPCPVRHLAADPLLA